MRKEDGLSKIILILIIVAIFVCAGIVGKDVLKIYKKTATQRRFDTFSFLKKEPPSALRKEAFFRAYPLNLANSRSSAAFANFKESALSCSISIISIS